MSDYESLIFYIVVDRGFSSNSKIIVNAVIGATIIAFFILIYYIVGGSEIIPYQTIFS